MGLLVIFDGLTVVPLAVHRQDPLFYWILHQKTPRKLKENVFRELQNQLSLNAQLTVSGVYSRVGAAAADDDADVVVNVELVADALGVATPECEAI